MVYDFLRALLGVHDLLVTVACGLSPHAWHQPRGARTTRLRRPRARRPSDDTPASTAFQPNARDGRDAPLLWIGLSELEAWFYGKRKRNFSGIGSAAAILLMRFTKCGLAHIGLSQAKRHAGPLVGQISSPFRDAIVHVLLILRVCSKPVRSGQALAHEVCGT